MTAKKKKDSTQLNFTFEKPVEMTEVEQHGTQEFMEETAPEIDTVAASPANSRKKGRQAQAATAESMAALALLNDSSNCW